MPPFLRSREVKGNEKISLYVVNIPDILNDHAIYVVDTDLGLSILFNEISPCALDISMTFGEGERKPVKNQNALEMKEKEEVL